MGAVPTHQYHIVAYDYGIKRNILRLFEAHGCRVTVVPSHDRPPTRCSPCSRTASSSPTARATRKR